MRSSFIHKIILILLLGGPAQCTFAQQALVSGVVKNAPAGKIYLMRPAFQFTINNIYQGWQKIVFNEKGEFTIAAQLAGPEIMSAAFYDSAGNHLLDYNFYLSPGDHLKMECSGNKLAFQARVTGKGASNNQPLAIDGNDGLSKFYGDTLPGKVVAYLGSQNKMHRAVLKQYIRTQHPTPDFISAWEANLQYEVLDAYFTFATNHPRRIEEAYERNDAKWNEVLEALYQKAPLVNEAALVATTYKDFLKTYLLRTKERLWRQFKTDRPGFLLEWYGKDTTEGAALFASDPYNDLQQRIIEKKFTGKLKEYLYVALFNEALGETEINNLVPIYKEFKLQFPSSTYLVFFDDALQKITSRMQYQLNSRMKFIDSARHFQTWEDILDQFKGKTVLLDMWGTWCGPCRQDLDRHSAFIKEYFKDKPLEYLYIANNDTQHEKTWKELIAFFHLEGSHILASAELTRDIMAKTNTDGYPAYIIIHKDGSFEIYKRGYGLNRDELIAQLEGALAR